MHETFKQFPWNNKTKSSKENSTFKIPVKHYSLAKCAFFNNYYIGYESNSEYFTMKSTEKLNPFVFDEDIAGQSNSFVQTFTVCTGEHAWAYAAKRAVVQTARWCNSQGLLKIRHFYCAAPEPRVRKNIQWTIFIFENIQSQKTDTLSDYVGRYKYEMGAVYYFFLRNS